MGALVARARGLPALVQAEQAFARGTGGGAAAGQAAAGPKQQGRVAAALAAAAARSPQRGPASPSRPAASPARPGTPAASEREGSPEGPLLLFASEGDLDDGAALLRGYGRLPTADEARALALQLAAQGLVAVTHVPGAPRTPLLALGFSADDIRLALQEDPLVQLALAA